MQDRHLKALVRLIDPGSARDAVLQAIEGDSIAPANGALAHFAGSEGEDLRFALSSKWRIQISNDDQPPPGICFSAIQLFGIDVGRIGEASVGVKQRFPPAFDFDG